MIIFSRKYEDERLRMVMPDGLTWPEVTDRFINFLQGCGYVVRGSDVAEHLMEQFAFELREEEELEPLELPKKKRRKRRGKKK